MFSSNVFNNFFKLETYLLYSEHLSKNQFLVAHPAGLEPTTFWSEARRSNPTELRVLLHLLQRVFGGLSTAFGHSKFDIFKTNLKTSNQYDSPIIASGKTLEFYS